MNENEKNIQKNELPFKNILNSPLAKMALATSLLVSAGTTAIGTPSLVSNEVLGVQTAEAAVFGSYEYTVSNGQATITAWNPKGYESANIPTHLGGYPVTAIGDYAFMSKWTNGFSIPSTVTSIGAYAFYDTEIEGTLTLPTNLKTIGENAFANNIITDLVIPNGLTQIGDFAFASNFLKTVSLKNITSIGHYAFSSNMINSITLPANLTSIGYGAFYFNRLTSLTIPSKVTFVGADAFNYNALTSVTVTNPNTVIEDLAFDGNQAVSTNLNIIGTDPSTAKSYALKHAHKFNGKILDVTPPTITLTSNVTNATKGDVTVSASVTDSASTISVKKWAVGNQNTSYFATGGTTLGDSFVVSENNTYTVYAKDSAGNEAVKTISINNIDKIAPDLATFTLSTTESTNENVTVSVHFPNDAETKEYSLNDGAWTPYSAPLVLSDNGTVKARSIDAAGNVSADSVLNLTNIDKVNPLVNKVELVENYLTVTASDVDSEVSSIEVKVGNDDWKAYEPKGTQILQNTTVLVRVVDSAGNTTEGAYDVVSDTYYKSLIGQITVLQDKLTSGGHSKAQLEQILVEAESILELSKDLVMVTEKEDIQAKVSKVISDIKLSLDAITDATNAVLKAETSMLQEDVEAALITVNALIDTPEKEDLLSRLEALQTIIDNKIALDNATSLVEGLGENPTQEQLDEVKQIVSDLSDSEGKNALLEQIENLQAELDAKEKAKLDLEQATELVKGLGEVPTQTELDRAKEKVEALENSKEKTELLNQIQELQDLLDAIEAAETKVIQAETSKTSQDVDAAQTLVNSLPDIPEKIALTDRLEKVKSEIKKQGELDNARAIVEQLGDSPTQEELNYAKEVVNKLDESPEKEELKKIIQEKQDAINLKVVNDKIDLLDNSTPSQLEIDAVKQEIEALPDGPEKELLINELEKIQDKKDLTDAEKLVDNLGNNPTQAEIDHARNVVEGLADSDGKTDLLDVIDAKQSNLDKLIDESTKAVENLHEGSTAEDFQQAKELVNKLPDGPEKDVLLEKLKEKEELMKERLALAPLLEKAETAVKHAEAFPTNFNIEIAVKAVNILPEVPEKEPLLERIQTIKDNIQLEDARKKVEQAERYERDPYLADAIQLVDALKDGDKKQGLKDRLKAISDKLKAIQVAEEEAKGDDGTFDPTNPDRSIEDAINTIQDVDAKNYLTRWHKANENASKYFSRAMTANASKSLEELPANYLAKASYAKLIEELTTRTENLAAAWQEASKDKATEQLFSKAYTLVGLYESIKNDRNYKNAVAAIEALPDSVSKTAIETQLASLKNHVEEEGEATLNTKEAIESTEKALTNYEKYKSSYYQKKATEAVEALTDSEEKTAFQLRLKAVTK